MSFLTQLFAGGAKELASTITDGVANLKDSHLSKRELGLKIEEMVSKHNDGLLAKASELIKAKSQIMIAELQQGDAYTKRARPTVIYVGLAAMIAQGFGHYTHFVLPETFWYAWAGAVGVYSFGRSKEKINGRRAPGGANPLEA